MHRSAGARRPYASGLRVRAACSHLPEVARLIPQPVTLRQLLLWIPEPGRQADFEQQSMSMSGDASTLTYSVGLHDEAVTPRRVVVY